MKKIVLLLAIFAISVSCMDKYEDTLQELGERVDKLEQKIPTIDQQIESIKESISLLEEADKALKAKDEELSNADRNLEKLISELKQYVNNEINATKSWAEASLFTLQKYNSAVSALARLEQSIASDKNAASQEISDAVSALRTSFQRWVGEQLAGHYSIAKADAEFDALRKSIEAGDEKLQGEIDDLQTAIAKSATDLTEAYQKAIEEAINDHNGVITAALNEELGEVNKRLDEELVAINAKLTALEAQIGKNAEDIAKLLARIQSISYIHKYADGKATMRQLGDLRHAVLQFEVTPKECVAGLSATWKDAMSAKGVCIIDDYKEFEEDMPILKFEADEENGIISVTISGENLPDWTFVEKPEIQVILTISDGTTAFTTDYISMAIRDYGGYDELIIPNNEIWYITSDEQPITIESNTSFNTKVLSNTYDNGFGRIVTDGEITSLAYNAFADPDLLSVNIPDSVADIEDGAFLSKSIIEFKGKHASNDGNYISVNNRLISVVAGLTTFEVPEHITSIGNSAFSVCTSLTSVTIPDSITEIGGSAFEGCTSLKDTYVNITDLAAYATSNPMHEIGSNIHLLIDGKELTELVIPESVIEIGDYAFYGCTSLKSVTIPDSVTKIGGSAFSGCTSELIINNKIIETNYSGNNCPTYNSEGWLYGSKFTKLTIGDGVTSIGGWAFYGCTSLASVTIPNSVTSIGERAFRDCTSLTSVTIPDSVTSIGDYAFYGCTSLTSITIPRSVTSIGDYAFRNCGLTSITIPGSVTEIGYNAFYGCCFEKDKFVNNSSLDAEQNGYWGAKIYGEILSDGLIIVDNTVVDCRTNAISVTIPDGVTSIGKSAFKDCTSLTSVTIPNSVTSIEGSAFYNCTSLASVTIPNSVTSIGDYAFYGCTSLTSIAIPDSVTSIGDYAFYGCTSLTSIAIPDSVTEIGGNAFAYCTSLTSITIPNSVTSIGIYAFYECTGELIINSKIVNNNYNSNNRPSEHGWLAGAKFTSLTIGDSVTSIGIYAFYRCTSLTSVTIGNSVTSIGDSAFYGCTSLASVTIPDSVTKIGEYAFYECSSLTSITIPNSVTSIGNYAFYECTGELIINNKIIETNYTYENSPRETWLDGAKFTKLTIGDGITKIGGSAFYECSSLRSITIPDSVTSIGSGAFYRCTSLRSITIPDSVTSIGSGAFFGCVSLTSITIGNSVTSIGGSVFSGCSSLTSITIGNSVTLIGDTAFHECSSLRSITIPDSVTSIGGAAFRDCTSLTSVTIGHSVTSIGNHA
ncbi:MAG: leucine-rich repeat protein, partial [Alistipes sp.]|nr:leucine-rich repeat protein [Alistipes sp.]